MLYVAELFSADYKMMPNRKKEKKNDPAFIFIMENLSIDTHLGSLLVGSGEMIPLSGTGR
jgi:hypothetical protein